MINRVFRLVDTKRMEMVQREVDTRADRILVRPEYISICAADQRYYLGNRDPAILTWKLPMALIHEGTGRVLFDQSGELKSGTKVAICPLLVEKHVEGIKENYLPDNKFMSSTADGFMQDILSIPKKNLVPLPSKDPFLFVFSELVSVAINALDNVASDVDSIGIWGDGSVGFIFGIVAKSRFPKAKLYVIGRTQRKLQKFMFANHLFRSGALPKGLQLDVCFECVGGQASEAALDEIIQTVRPQGSVGLVGVSENRISVNTRSILEKGIHFDGISRSSIEDFREAVALIKHDSICRKYLQTLVSEVITIKTENDISYAFEQDLLNDFKTVIKWEV